MKELVGTLSAAGHTAAYFAWNVTDEGQVYRLIDRTVEKFGRLDYAYNNAGLMLGDVKNGLPGCAACYDLKYVSD